MHNHQRREVFSQRPDPKIQHPRDAIIKITACAICGSDLHLLDGYQPTMKEGDILGHENMGEVIELGSEVTNLKIGDRVVVPFTISCGQCWFCQKDLFSCCDRTNPNHEVAAKAMGQSPAGLFGFSHMLGGYSGGQAEFLRVPMADDTGIETGPVVTDCDGSRRSPSCLHRGTGKHCDVPPAAPTTRSAPSARTHCES